MGRKERAMRSLLLVDDSLTALSVAKSYLESKSFAVTALSDASKAIDMASDLRPDLVVLDYELPGMKGDELCARLKALEPTSGIPVMILTSHTNPEIEARCMEAGAAGFVQKGVGRETLLDEVCKVLGLPRRAHVRVPCQLKVGLLSGGIEERATAHNLSQSGLYLTAAGKIGELSLVRLNLSLPGRKEDARILGEVVRSEVLDGGMTGYGIQFIEADPEVLEALKAFVSAMV